MKRNAYLRSVTIAACATVLLCGLAPAAESAKTILDATGVRGGLVVHVGCGDGKLTAALRVNDSYVVHGLDADAANVAAARTHIASLGLTGKVSVDRAGGRLPYIDNLAALVVADSADLARLGVSLAEVTRVLRPDGVAYVKTGGAWQKTVKPRPTDIDEWTHYLHDASGNAVADDAQIAPPRHMQWVAAPVWSRNHHTLASISAIVTAAGRIFYIMDSGPSASMSVPGRWFVVARDAFSGVQLWRRPLPDWVRVQHKFRSGPVQLPRLLVVDGDRVYAPDGISAPITQLDAATGKVLQTYKATEAAEEIVLTEGILVAVAASPISSQAAGDPARSGTFKGPITKAVVAVDAKTGRQLWKWADPASPAPAPETLAAADNRVFFKAGKGVTCLDLASGKKLWDSEQVGAAAPAGKAGQTTGKGKARKPKPKPTSGGASTLVVHDGVVILNSGGVRAFSAKTGKELWSGPGRAGFRSPGDVFVIGGQVWIGPGFTEARDLKTGQVTKTTDLLSKLQTVGHHHRCYREKATTRYILAGKRGIEFMDLVGDNHSRNNWVRGVCQYGVMPANGLVYAPSHACGCFMEAKLYGFWAVAAQRTTAPTPAGPQLEKGPAFGQAIQSRPNDDDWPTYRQNPLRSGTTAAAAPTKFNSLWQASVGDHLSAPVIAAGVLFVADIDAHKVVALDAATGKPHWTYTTGGRVDSPPTIHEGRALFGSADGWVYCLRVSDGELIWRFQAAPQDVRSVSLDQVESVWPVHGSVLVENGVAYATAGRYTHLDGGIRIYGLDPATGRKICESVIQSQHPKGIEGLKGESTKFSQNATDGKTYNAPDKTVAFSMAGTRSDVLVSNGSSIFLRNIRLNRQCQPQAKPSRHLFSTARLLDDNENHRSHWVVGTGDFSRTPVAYSWIANKGQGAYGSVLAPPYGVILAFDAKTVWGVQKMRDAGYTLFAEQQKPFSDSEEHQPDFRKPSAENQHKFNWKVDLGMRPRAIVRAGGQLLLGGMPSELDARDPYGAYEGRKGGLLWAVSTADGSTAGRHKLPAPPVWDGLAAAGGRLYVATIDGKVLCLGSK